MIKILFYLECKLYQLSELCRVKRKQYEEQEDIIICKICGAEKDSDDACETCNDDARNLKR